jgi:hypothetical protein
MNPGEIPFDMTSRNHPTGSEAYALFKRWKKHTIYAKSGSWNRTENPNDNLYVTNSVYLYDYVSVTKEFYDSLTYTSSIADSVPSKQADWVYNQSLWWHRQGSFLNRPNSTTNNYLIQITPTGVPNTYTYSDPIFIDGGEYFEVVDGYPRNHRIYKRDFFSLDGFIYLGGMTGQEVQGAFRRCEQTINSTVGQDGLEDGTAPVQTFQVSNVNLVQSDNVINR